MPGASHTSYKQYCLPMPNRILHVQHRLPVPHHPDMGTLPMASLPLDTESQPPRFPAVLTQYLCIPKLSIFTHPPPPKTSICLCLSPPRKVITLEVLVAAIGVPCLPVAES